MLGKTMSFVTEPSPPCIDSVHVGYYPPSETVAYTEDTPPSDANELTRLCKDWEESAKLPENCPTRLVTARIGVVLGKEGGLVQQAIWPFWLGLGGERSMKAGFDIHASTLLTNCSNNT